MLYEGIIENMIRNGYLAGWSNFVHKFFYNTKETK